MCGINGYISKSLVNNEKIKNIASRGPDDKNIINFKNKDYNVFLSFFRLAIINLKSGMQPFIHKDKNLEREIYLLCNGEIYNYKKIINNFNINTESDCHVILYLYLQIGIEKTVQELDGEFAFVLLDIEKDNFNVYFCRDRFGIRPLFYEYNETGFYFSSELKGLVSDNGKHVEPRNIYNINFNTGILKKHQYYFIEKKYEILDTYRDLLTKIKDTLIDSVKLRMISERPIGCLLSGGLDSSLIAGIASRILQSEGKRLTTFSIGMDNDSPDIEYARKVAKHINSIHREIIIPVEKWIENLPNLIKQIETYDITTIRATSAQYLLAKWISENTDIKVLLNGDGSDEICAGYIYFYNAPNENESHKENIRLLNEIHMYDVLRVDRGISCHGLEARVPFLSSSFVDLYLSIDPDIRNPVKGKRMEKFLLRNAFLHENIVPNEVLMRKKEAFSDGISSYKKSWFEYIKEYVETQVSDSEFINFSNKFPSKEAYWYKKIYDSHYKSHDNKINYWMPKWCEIDNEPSARVLKNY